MEIRAFAEQVLSGTTIEDKISAPDAAGVWPFADDAPGPALDTPPDLPGRPPELAFDRRPPHADQFPGGGRLSSKLTDPRGRGIVLHYFANHELLALEVMALALLRFPDAPKAFRSGIVRTMLEEQAHLKMYIRRMAELGVTFGTLPVNSFFWRTLKNIASPAEYAAAMSLTFEQANLDFALHYEKSFRDLGDDITADIMLQIHNDEVRHVEHGVIWLRRFEAEKTLWESYLKHLPFPLTPSRAKGPVFDELGRARAGIDPVFISELKVFSSSKGRPADFWFFNPGCERELACHGKLPFMPTKAAFIEHDLSPLLMFLSAADDLVMVSRKPSLPFLSGLKLAGFSVPEFIEAGETPNTAALEKILGSRKLGSLRPWGQTPAAMAWFAPLANRFTRMPGTWPRGFDVFFGKDFAARVAPDDYSGQLCRQISEVAAVADQIKSRGFSHLAVKPVLGASGLGLRRIAVEALIASEADASVISENVKIDLPCIAEPWLDKVCDLSVLFDVEKNTGNVRIIDITRPLIDRSGKYSGHALGRPFTFPDANAKPLTQDFFSQFYSVWMDQLRESALDCGRKMAAEGFSGPAGIDALVFRDPQDASLCLRPVVEINPRLSMGRIAIHLERRLARGQPALWLHIHKNVLHRTSHHAPGKGFADFSVEMARRFPLVTTSKSESAQSDILIKSGFLPTNDPEMANGILTALFAGRDAAQYAWNLLYQKPD